MPFRVGLTELIFGMVVLALLFGARRPPEFGSSLRSAIRCFRRGVFGADEEAITGGEE